ncbi:MAG: S1C family serine protease [Chitinophagaceae bacterium]
MKIKNIVLTVLISSATALFSVFIYSSHLKNSNDLYENAGGKIPVNYTSFQGTVNPGSQPTDFVEAASIASPTAVHIMTKTQPRQVSNNLQRGNNPFSGLFGNQDPFSQFFGNGGGRYYEPGQMASGTGVIISDDGYIVTCNHVVEGADEITVTLNDKRTYKAKVIGTDPNTDLAVLKINAHGLPYLLYGNSDKAKVGQWVLAIGYPLDLQTTVTAGIISAKSRQIGVNKDGRNPIESFIQTDAAVNPGNSGGPLVNTQGQLIGINSAIASPTGSFAGYAYAIPVNLVKKVVNDILKYGTVQRAYLGIEFPRISNENSAFMAVNNNGEASVDPLLVEGVTPNGGAALAGIQKGDIITQINGEDVHSFSQLLGIIASHQPGDKVNLTYKRNGKVNHVMVTLKNRDGNTAVVRNSILDELGADFQSLSKSDARKLGIQGGVLVGNIGSGIIRKQTDMEPGFIITQVGKYPIQSVEGLKQAFAKQGNNVQIEGIYQDADGMYYYGLNNLKDGD